MATGQAGDGLDEKQLERKEAVDMIQKLRDNGIPITEITAVLKKRGHNKGKQPQVKYWLKRENKNVPKKPAEIILFLKKAYPDVA